MRSIGLEILKVMEKLQMLKISINKKQGAQDWKGQ